MALWSVTSAIIYAMEHTTLRTRKRIYVPAAVLMPEVGLGEEAREGKEGKGAGRTSAIDLPIAGRSHNHYLCHLSQMCLSTDSTLSHGCISMTKNHTPLWLAWQHKHCVNHITEGALLHWHLLLHSGVKCYSPHDKLPVVSCDWTVYTFCLLHFLMFGREGGLNLESILRKTLLEHLPALTGSRQDDSLHRPWASLRQATVAGLILCAKVI